MKVVAILQARIHSTRLPGKMLLPLLDKPLVQHVIERVQRAKRIDDIVLAVPSSDAADFSPIANGRAWLYSYAGDESDLVGRYLAAAQAFDAEIIVRIPCDNPCVDPEYIDQAIEDYLDAPMLFLSNTTELVKHGHSTYWVDGIGAEVFSLSRLKWLDRKTVGDPDHRQHPHKYFQDRYMDNEYPDCGICMSVHPADYRLDVNTQEEYECIKDIYDHFGHNRFTLDEIVSYLTTKEASHESIQREQPSGNSQQRA